MDTLKQILPVALFSVYGNLFDMTILISYKIWQDWKLVQPHIQQLASHIDFNLVIIFTKTIVTLLTLLQVTRYIMAFQVPRSGGNDFAAKPMLFPCRTAHTRFFPKKHHFSYSFLMAGVPVGWKGVTGGMLSVDLPATNGNWIRRLVSLKPWSPWYTVNGDDHLARGHVEGGLEEKLHDFLHSQV